MERVSRRKRLSEKGKEDGRVSQSELREKMSSVSLSLPVCVSLSSFASLCLCSSAQFPMHVCAVIDYIYRGGTI